MRSLRKHAIRHVMGMALAKCLMAELGLVNVTEGGRD
jgi:hypothetical protein